MAQTTEPNGNKIDQIIGANVRGLREARGLSRQALADLMRTSLHQLDEYEVGITRIPVYTLYTLSCDMRVTVRSFFDTATVATE